MPDIPTVNEKLLQRYIRHSVYLEQLKKGEASLISRFLGKKVFPSLSEKLIGELGKIKNLETLGSIRNIPAKRLTRMMLAVRKTAQVGAVKAEKMLVKRLINISRFEADWNSDIISKTVPFDLDMSMPSNEVLRNLVTMRPMDGHKLGTWMSGYSTAIRVAMTKQIKVGIATGESLPAIGARINKALNWKGKQAQYIARTAVSNVVHQAREEVFKKNKDIVRKVQWVATLDDRTSLICINYDGKMFDVGYGERPPAHFNCRSTVVPVTPSWQEYGVVDPPAATRASMNGAVPAKMNYRTWLKKQPKSVQVKVLGKKRAELYRSGQVKIDRFVGKDLKPLNLKQLARREGLDLAPAPSVTITKVPATFAKTTSADIRKLVDDTIDAYPEKVKVALNKNGTSYNIGNSLTEINPRLKGLQPVGWSKGSTWDNVSGVYDMKTNTVSIAETYLPRGKKLFVANSKIHIRRVLNHESGHAFDSTLGKGLNVYSNQSKFQQAYWKDITKLSKADIAKYNLRFYLQKGVRGRSEAFADVFGDIMGGGARPGISKFFPNSAKYIDDILKAKTVSIVKAKPIIISKVKAAPIKPPVTKVKATESGVKKFSGEIKKVKSTVTDYEKKFDKWVNDLDDKAKAVIEAYTKDESGTINIIFEKAAKGELPHASMLSPYEIKALIQGKKIIKIMKLAPKLPSEITLHSGIGFTKSNINWSFINTLKEGEVFNPKGFLSTSKFVEQANKFAGIGKARDAVSVRLHIVKHKSGVDISTISPQLSEGEILFAPDSKFRIIKRVESMQIIEKGGKKFYDKIYDITLEEIK